MRTWIVSIVFVLSSSSAFGIGEISGPMRMDFNSSLKVAELSPQFRPFWKTVAPQASRSLACEEFRYIRGVCERVKTFIAQDNSSK